MFVYKHEYAFLALGNFFRHSTNTSIFNHLESYLLSIRCFSLNYYVWIVYLWVSNETTIKASVHNMAFTNESCTFCFTHGNKQAKSCWLILLHVTNNKTLQELIHLFCTQGFWSLWLFKADSKFLRETPDFSWQTFASFVKKNQQIFWWVTDVFHSGKLSWQTTLLTRDDKALTCYLCLRIYRTAAKADQT